MGNNIVKNVNDFLIKAIKSEEILSKCCNEIDIKEKNIDKYLKNFNEYINKAYNKKSLNNKNKFIQEANKNIDALISDIKGWNLEVDNLKKGCEFITKFDDKMIVVIFGKVNSGKSSLGNLVMGSTFRKNLNTKYSDINVPIVEVYDRGAISTKDKLEELENKSGFVEDSTEATSTIQLFKLGGMAWVDTPGIGSLTKENEDLAKEYVKNADLVIYITSSDAAGTQQDFKELEDLKGRKKPIVLAVSKSDTIEEDEDEDGEIIWERNPKDYSDRKEVEAYLKNELIDKNLGDVLNHSEIITMSTMLAIDAIAAKNNDKYNDSNIDKLYDKLGEVMSKKAVEFKTNNPKNRINALINDIVYGKNNDFKGIEEVKRSLFNSKKIITEAKEDLINLEGIVLSKIKTSSRASVLEYVSNKSDQIQDGSIKELKAEEISDYCNKVGTEIYREELAKAINKILDSFDYEFKKDLSINVNLHMKKMYDTIEYDQKESYREERDPSGIFENIGGFFGRKYYRKVDRTVIKKTKFEIGINENEVIEEIMNNMEESIKACIKNDLEEISSQYFDKIEKYIDDISNKLDELKLRLVSEMYEDR